MIEITDLTKAYDSVPVLQKINLTINDGDIYGLVGTSGVGKSTLLRCINGLEPYDSGSLKADGVEIASLDKKALREYRKNIGMIFQSFSLIDRISVFSNVAMPMECWKYSKNEIRQRVEYLLELVGLKDRMKARPTELSGGQKQRVAIARALTMNPRYILSDESTSALDPKTTKNILGLLREINQTLGITIVVVTHEMHVVQELCNNISIMEGGVLTASGAVRDIFLQKPAPLTRLMGEEAMDIPAAGITLAISMDEKAVEGNLFYHISRLLQEEFTLLSGDFSANRTAGSSNIVINIAEADFPDLERFMEDKSISYRLLQKGGFQ